MFYNVRIEPSGLNFSVKVGEIVLDAALRQGFQFPHDCLSGTCGTCRGRLLEGEVEYDEPFLPGLTDEEREEGFALFCSAKPKTDLIVHVEGVIGPAQLPVKKASYDVQAVEALTCDTFKIILQPSDAHHLIYYAGQYLNILHRDSSPRPFSIANAPLGDTKTIELHIRDLPNNPYVTQLLAEIKTTKKLSIEGPFGNCVLRSEPPYPMIFLAGGVGFAPIKALIEQALSEGVSQPIYLYWGARQLSDLYMHALAQRWEKHVPNFHYIPVLSEPSETDNWSGRVGLIHEAVLAGHASLAQHHVYASGPTEMVYAALHAFQQRGLDRAFMYSDMFELNG